MRRAGLGARRVRPGTDPEPLRALRDELGIAYFFITHDLAVVRQLVERIYVLHQGQVVEAGPVDSVLDNPQDPYTIRLVESVPRSEGEWLSKP